MATRGVDSSGAPIKAGEQGNAPDGVVVLNAVPGEALTVPHGTFLLVADFDRQGSDLLLTGPDGEQVLVRGYFALENPPALTVLPPYN